MISRLVGVLLMAGSIHGMAVLSGDNSGFYWGLWSGATSVLALVIIFNLKPRS